MGTKILVESTRSPAMVQIPQMPSTDCYLHLQFELSGNLGPSMNLLYYILGSSLFPHVLGRLLAEGSCRNSPDDNSILIYASGYWQSMPRGFSTCVNGSLIPFNGSVGSLSHGETSFPMRSLHATSANGGLSTPMTESSTQLAPMRLVSPQPSHASCEVKGETGNSRCTNQTLACRSTDRGVASYAVGGKMASMYDRLGGAFRCDIEPDSSLYVAVWTPYNSSAQSQPRPESCGKKWTFTNPRTRTSAVAMVVDRCASCVGVGRQTSDPTTADIFVNGATVDLSRDLWDLLYDGEPPGVYDIDYDGPVWLGTAAEPEILQDPNCGV